MDTTHIAYSRWNRNSEQTVLTMLLVYTWILLILPLASMECKMFMMTIARLIYNCTLFDDTSSAMILFQPG